MTETPNPNIDPDTLTGEMRPIRPAVFSLGSNSGDRLANLQGAINAFADTPDVNIVAVSSVYETTPVNAPDGSPEFLNAILLADTTLSVSVLLDRAMAVEDAYGRERIEPNGPRTLDVDLVVVGDRISDTDELKLPHPRAHLRAFVLVPWHRDRRPRDAAGTWQDRRSALRPRHHRRRSPTRSRARDLAVGRPAEPGAGHRRADPRPGSAGPLPRRRGARLCLRPDLDRRARVCAADPVDLRHRPAGGRGDRARCWPTRRTEPCTASASGWTRIERSASCCSPRRAPWSARSSRAVTSGSPSTSSTSWTCICLRSG